MSSKPTTVDLQVEGRDAWSTITQDARKSVAKIHVCHTRHLDLSRPLAGQGTAFYIDEDHGFMLTNKHIAGPAPCRGFVVFEDNFELDVLEITYTDPELDFSILRIDAAKARFHGIRAIPIAAQKAAPGLSVCFIGNDRGDGISIGQATINRTDIKPDYKHEVGDVRSVNGEEIQAMFSAVGGSSGGPALNMNGEAVGMMMSVEEDIARINYLLPLYYPAKAMKNLAAGEVVPRGTIQVRWSLQPLHECNRYGLPTEWDHKIRAQRKINAIVAEVVLQGGPADGELDTGDILLEIDGGLCNDLYKLSMYMDEHIGEDIRLRVWRQDQEVVVQCRVEDLHAISPGHFIDRFSTVFHSIDWRTAAWARVPVGSVYIASAPDTGVFKAGHLIESVDGSPVPNMERLSEALNSLGRGGRHITTIHKQIGSQTQTIETFEYLPTDDVERPLEMRRKPREGGDWVIEDSALKPSRLTGSDARAKQLVRTVLPKNNHPPTANEIFHSVVSLRIYRSEDVDGCGVGVFMGNGILLEQGLVITYRGSSTRLDEIRLKIAVGVEVAAKVVFMHEAVNFILVEYNTAEVPDGLDLRKADLSERDHLQEGDGVYFAAFDIATEKRVVYTYVDLLGQRTSDIIDTGPFVPFHHETILLRSVLSNSNSGIVMYEDGKVAGLQQVGREGAGEHYFLPISRVKIILGFWKAKRLGDLHFQDFDVSAVPLANASPQTVAAVSGHCSAKTQVLVVDKVPLHCAASNGLTNPHPLRKGDVIIKLDHKTVVQSSDLQYVFTDSSIAVLVLRDGKITEFTVPTIPADQAQVIEIVRFCGALVHRPSLRCRLVHRPCHSEVYIANQATGSPSHLHELYAQAFIDLVDGNHITTMEDFKRAISVSRNTYFAVRIQYFNESRIVSVKKDETYWPSFIYTADKHQTFLF